jgi:hypothetical protein
MAATRRPGRLLLVTLLVLTVVSGLVDAVSALAGASAFLHAGAPATLAVGAFVVLVSGVAFWAATESRSLDQPATRVR